MDGVDSAGTAVLQLDLGYPDGPVSKVYETTSPCLQLGKQEPCTERWGTCRVAVAPGRYRIRVWAQSNSSRLRFGKAEASITIGPNETVCMDYRAPIVPGSVGRLHPSAR